MQLTQPVADRILPVGGDCRKRSPDLSVLSRVLGLGGSSSRMIRSISSNAGRHAAASWSKGVVPVSSS